MMQEFADLFGRSLWLMEPKAMQALLARAKAATPETIQAAIKAYSDREQTVRPAPLVGDVAVMSMTGPIVYRDSWLADYFGFATIERMRAQFQTALNDPAVRSIVWRCHSPGGMVDMVPEFADEVFAARGEKPITFVADTLLASCAYWIASQGDKIIATRSSWVGAIGTYIEHEDFSKMLEQAGITVTLIQHGEHKTDGHPAKPLSEEAKADMQAYVDEVGEEFEAAVARGRGVTRKVVVDTFGQGKAFRGKQAIALGLADKLGTFNQIINKAGTKPRSARADGDGPELRGETATAEDPAAAAAPGTETTETPAVDAAAPAAAGGPSQAQKDADLTASTLALITEA